MIKKLEFIARDAGAIILKYYDISVMGINIKSDGSYITNADLEAENIIVSMLKKKLFLSNCNRRNTMCL